MDEMEESRSDQKVPVLVADDDPASRKLLKKVLSKTGYDVVCVENGREALALFSQRSFPIVVTDWMMPEMDGLSLSRAIRKDTPRGDVYILLMTASAIDDDLIMGPETGADDYLTKPIVGSELVFRLKTGRRILKLERSLKEANDAIRRLSVIDSLTGCYNRAFLTKKLTQEINRAERYERSLSVIFCGIDHFAEVNDTYGYQSGNTVLREFSDFVMKSIRGRVDWLSRYGGEEFMVVFPETDLEGANAAAERLRAGSSQMGVDLVEGRINISASFGVTGIDGGTPNGGVSVDAMIEAADKYRYRAKESGRNRVVAGPVEA
jgi:diguanylate cyclase (GGDEF)-like protein